MSIRQWLRKPFVRSRFARPVDLTGKHVVVTGASVGSLGFETARTLARWGAFVVVTTRARSEESAGALLEQLGQSVSPDSIVGYDLDLSEAQSVKAFCQWYRDTVGERLDVLVNNAGIHLDLMSQWKQPKLSRDGVELHWRTNYLGTLQLSHELLPLLLKTAEQFGEARVVNVVSQLHSRGSNALLFDTSHDYESWQAYGLSKLALIHFTNELHRRYNAKGLQSYSLHPGGKSGAYTNVADKGLEGHRFIAWLRKLGAPIEKLLMATAEEGAQTQLHCATAPGLKSGQYYVNCAVSNASSDCADQTAALRVWDKGQAWLTTVS